MRVTDPIRKNGERFYFVIYSSQLNCFKLSVFECDTIMLPIIL